MRLVAVVCSCVLFCGLSSHAVPALTFETEVFLGEVVAGDVGERVVELGNSGDAALHVSKVRACCGASAVLETSVLPPGTKGRLTVSYRPLVPSGEFRKTVYIHSDDPARPIAQLEITGTAVAERRREPGRESPAVETTQEDRDAPREADRPGLLSGTMLAVVLAGIADGFNPCGAEKGSELIDTQSLTHLACLGYAVHHEEDEEIEHRHEKSMREAMSEILAAVSMELCQ